MSTPKKSPAKDELSNIEDALIESILESSEEELRTEFAEAGLDAEDCIKEVGGAIASAQSEFARTKLESARAELLAWQNRSNRSHSLSVEASRERLSKAQAGDPALEKKMMLAARKGEGPSQNDFDYLAEDLAEIEDLEREEEGG